MLYRSTDRLCRCGAPMKNLAHSASFESLDKNAPSNAGTKHLDGTSEYSCSLRGFSDLPHGAPDAEADDSVVFEKQPEASRQQP
jgi:hypothetical protein